MVKNVDLSVGITTHDEGYLVHKTLRYVFEGLSRLEEQGYTYEILINVDNGDETTKNYLKQYEKDKRFTILYTKFKDLGLSRNNVVSHAKGKYLGFIDGDDMASPSWFLDAVKYLENSKDKNLVLHPSAVLIFGTDINPVYCPVNSSFSKAEDATILLGSNRWTSLVLAPRDVFVKTPYMITANGFGYEDYFFNSEVIAKGARHIAVPNTVMFYRRKRESLLSRSDANHVVQPYSDLFSIDFFRSMPAPAGAEMFGEKSTKGEKYVQTNFSKKLPAPLRRPYLAMRNNESLNSKIIPLAKAVKKVVHPRVGKKNKAFLGFDIPQFLIEDWRALNKIENQLYPSEYVLNEKLEFFEIDGANRKVGPAFWHLAQQIPVLPDYIFIMPWLIAGGAERVVLNYIEAFAEIHPDWKIAVITTEKKQNTWANKLPKNAYLIDFGNTAAKIHPSERELLFNRLMMQLKCSKIHIVNSAFAYRWVAMHKDLVKANFHVNVSIFCSDVFTHPDGGKEICGYIDPSLFEIFTLVDNVFTDNAEIINQIIEQNGYVEKNKFKVHYQPSTVEIAEPHCDALRQPMKLLWASRITPQKQPDLLSAIAEKLEKQFPGEYRIDVYGTLDKDAYKQNPVTKAKNLKYCGSFSKFTDLKTEQYDALLYTAKYDGLPNIILEATAAGLPIITSNAGGIGEIIKDQQSGLLVKDLDLADAFVDAIVFAKKHSEDLPKYVDAAQKILKEEHSWQSFIKTLKKDF